MVNRFLRSSLFLALAFIIAASMVVVAPNISMAAASVNVNTATVEQLQQVKGIGPKTAEKIVAYRQENGKFTSLDELQNIRGIGAKSLNSMTENLSLEQ